ncbi:MAG: chorismate synthase [Kiritimatiellia bacterium]
MSSTWGENIRISLFGESHGPAIGVVIDGLPSGFALDFEALAAHMRRRAPGQGPWATPRREPDAPEILSGVFNGRTTGTPLAAIIRNADTRSGDYADLVARPRPGHADLTGRLRYGGANDPRGGGHFSGRLTAPLAFAGAVCLQMLAARGVRVGARAVEIGGVRDAEIDPTAAAFDVSAKAFPVVDDACGERMKAAIQAAHARKDSVGGIVEAVASGMPAGVGGPFFDRLGSRLGAMLFALPACKGVEFGRGFAVAGATGLTNNDAFRRDDAGNVTRPTNHAGGMEGGIANGMPIIVRCAFKPTASIGAPQPTVNLDTGAEETLEIQGRHDPCIVPRAVPVVESAVALVLLDRLLDGATPPATP